MLYVNESDEVIMARALQIMQATLERRDAGIARLKPRTDFANHVLDSMATGNEPQGYSDFRFQKLKILNQIEITLYL